MNNAPKEDFFREYRERYNVYWVRRWGMIPHLPTSLDNSNSIYELLAWLQRAFKGLLDDFINMQLEFDDFKNGLINLIEKLIPELIRQFVKSDEFKKIILGIINDWYEKEVKPILDNHERRITDNAEAIENIKETIKTINNRLTELEKLVPRIEALEEKVENLTTEINNLKKSTSLTKGNLDKILNKLAEIGVWNKTNNSFNEGMGVAGGNINLFGGSQDGNSFIRTNNSSTENDLTGGI